MVSAERSIVSVPSPARFTRVHVEGFWRAGCLLSPRPQPSYFTMHRFTLTPLLLSAFLVGARAAPPAGSVVTALFEATDASLQRYQCPEWFRDAKFGIWAVWGPQSVPMQGDWYAHNLYLETQQDRTTRAAIAKAHPQNVYHNAHYGHPSQSGFKDIIPLWKAEHWDPDRLMALYQRAGAKYFCMIAMHHDNFDCWDSFYQRWNVVNMGPKRDIAGEWQQAARKYGLRFGMTEHLAASWWFYSSAKGSDSRGPMKGVPYDGADPRYEDLYWRGNESPNFHYYSSTVPAFVQETWFNRVKDLIDRYHPDLLYSDSPLPYADEYGRRLLAHYYNDNLRRHEGRLEAVYNCKQDAEHRWVRDLERGVMEGINPEPWQTDTCVGGWYYKTGYKYKTAAQIVHMLADVVSKNGNLLLNFPPRPDGTLDEQEEKILADLGDWMATNGEAIFGTRPWNIFGEGPIKPGKGRFGGLHDTADYTSADIRFTTKAGALYAIALGWPQEGPLTVRSLPASAGKVAGVSLLGHAGQLNWRQTSDGLVVELPAQKPCALAYAYKIMLGDSKPVP